MTPELDTLAQVSARSVWEHQGFRSPFEWKIHSFEDVIANHYTEFYFVNTPGESGGGNDQQRDGAPPRRQQEQLRRRPRIPKNHWNVISVGDSAHEREALIGRAKELNLVRWKSLKFMERPTPKQMERQHQWLRAALGRKSVMWALAVPVGKSGGRECGYST